MKTCIQLIPVERLVTCWTDVRFHSGVGKAVTGEVARLPKRPGAYLTLERFISRVDPLKEHEEWICKVLLVKDLRSIRF